MKTLEDEQYIVIKAYKFTVFEIWGDFNVLSYIVCPRYPYIRVYRLMVQNPYISFFRYTRIMEKDPCMGAVYLIVCDHPSLVSILFAILLSLHLVTF